MPSCAISQCGQVTQEPDGPTGLADSLWSRPYGRCQCCRDLGLSARHHRRVRALLLWCSLSRPGANLHLQARRLVIVRDCPSESVTVRQRPRAHSECDVHHILSRAVGTGGRPAVDAHDQDPRRTTEPARELAGKPAQTGTPTALGQACHVAVHAVTVAVELGDAGMHSVKRLPGQLTSSRSSSTAALRN